MDLFKKIIGTKEPESGIFYLGCGTSISGGTLSDMDIGISQGNRKILVGVIARHTTSTLTNVTVNGASPDTFLISESGTLSGGWAIFSGIEGETADIVITAGTTIDESVAVVYSEYGEFSDIINLGENEQQSVTSINTSSAGGDYEFVIARANRSDINLTGSNLILGADGDYDINGTYISSGHFVGSDIVATVSAGGSTALGIYTCAVTT